MALVKHFMKVSNGNKSFQKALANLLDEASDGDVGLVLSERIINMPAAVIPPSYKMLLEEIKWANEDVFHHCSTFN
jgi:BCCIP